MLYGSFIINASEMSSNRHAASTESSSDSLWPLNINAYSTECNDNIAESNRYLLIKIV